MNHTNKLLDTFKKVCSHKTDMAAAAAIGVSRGTVSSWRHELRHAEPESVQAMARASKLDADEWVLRVQADREGSVNPERAKVWLRCAKRITQTAASCALIYVTLHHGSAIGAKALLFAPSIHYAKLAILVGMAIAVPCALLLLRKHENDWILG